MHDPQYTNAFILRPFTNFESIYGTGAIAGTTPIMFTPEGVAVEPGAGSAGISPRLVNGLKVSFGCRLLLWLPFATNTNTTPYVFTLAWRLRSLYEFRTQLENRGQYHLAIQHDGVAETGPEAGARIVKPAAYQAVTYNQTEPAGTMARVIQNNRCEDVSVRVTNLSPPLMPASVGGNGYLEQGVINPFPAVANPPHFQTYEASAAGDELLVGCYRTTMTPWDFTVGGEDRSFSFLFGNGQTPVDPNEQMGVYVFIGNQ